MDHRILRAARELIDEVGYPALTVDRVAARAGVGKAAIYRRYASKAEMAFAATVHERQPPVPAGTGSLHGDLLALVRAFHVRMAAPAARQLAPALIGELAGNPELGTRFQDTFLAAEQALFAEIVEQAVARGELAGPVDPAMAHLLLLGSLASALYILDLPVDDAMLADLAAAVAAGITALADRHRGVPGGAAGPP
ncbi:TetR/AcrR family transcriptional regulator [Streptomyces somaliensis DSM 40738]|uniref:TetR/AcrR family transcriptional regulator n=1 Tax=Streptomyces somaliensis (strain ATCC 33201 / DSM 40738 / JCM 12659 / KCTC 9044 / NCTC 11332 / NRRL B-12077 / IP 733) TaxID=1134445 RepID=A0AA44DCB0_STRE0|nr:TetR/AcrR family transcriptional regulator [Streptomyces somaliensis]MCQ0023110.1 TetR/AcrR family transcriptional regulator [Streptomyces somaliensis DSM 40738]NKY13632.1 TetR/AcrR family transcriptional regulator [Streptomyces somaliensis DSM 40738]